MKFPAALAMLAATALAQPVADPKTYVSPDGLTVRGTGYQGDGFYLATFDENNVATVQFTPLEALNTTMLKEYNAQTAPSDDNLQKRAGIECAGSGYTPDMDTANVQLAQNGNGNYYGYHAWGWVHYNSATSYFCNYQAQTLTYDILIQFQVDVSNYCGGSQVYGFDRCTNGCGISDLAVGRTYTGDHFCADGFYG